MKKQIFQILFPLIYLDTKHGTVRRPWLYSGYYISQINSSHPFLYPLHVAFPSLLFVFCTTPSHTQEFYLELRWRTRSQRWLLGVGTVPGLPGNHLFEDTNSLRHTSVLWEALGIAAIIWNHKCMLWRECLSQDQQHNFVGCCEALKGHTAF